MQCMPVHSLQATLHANHVSEGAEPVTGALMLDESPGGSCITGSTPSCGLEGLYANSVPVEQHATHNAPLPELRRAFDEHHQPAPNRPHRAEGHRRILVQGHAMGVAFGVQGQRLPTLR